MKTAFQNLFEPSDIKTCIIHHAAAQGKADLSPLKRSIFTSFIVLSPNDSIVGSV